MMIVLAESILPDEVGAFCQGHHQSLLLLVYSLYSRRIYDFFNIRLYEKFQKWEGVFPHKKTLISNNGNHLIHFERFLD